MAKTLGFIDGFNLYHAIIQKDPQGNRPYEKYKWLDYWKLVECFLGANDSLVGVYYFTAYVSWPTPKGRQKKKRHQLLVSVLKDRGIRVVLGRFRPVWKRCRGTCKELYQTYEEKRTDVNIALAMLELANQGAYEKAVLISADSDLVPVLEAVRRVDPSIHIRVVAPVNRTAQALFQKADSKRRMRPSHLKKCLLPPAVTLSNGVVVQCPPQWY